MNSLSYLSRQIDVLATSGTPPSTPINASHLNAPGRPPRAKSYSRIAPRRQQHHGPSASAPGQHQQHHPQEDASFPGHQANKRSFSSPALWSFRKPTLTPNSSAPSTPAPSIKRTTSYFSGQAVAPGDVAAASAADTPAPDGVPSPIPEEIEPTSPSASDSRQARPLLLRILNAVWDLMYALWLRASGILFIPSLLAPQRIRKGVGPEEEVDSAAEESEDDGIVTRAPKRSSPDLSLRHTDPDVLSTSIDTYQMSSTAVMTKEDRFQQLEPMLSLEPPTPEEVQERTETPRIDLVPPTPRSVTPSQSIMARRKTEGPSSLLPSPFISSLLVKSTSTGPSIIAAPSAAPPHQIIFPSQRRMQGVRLPKTLVLDLDETLIHSTSRPMRAHAGGGLFSMGGFGFGFGEKRGREAGHMVEVVLGGRCTLYHVYKRPFVDYFLRKVSSWYTLVIFTASMQEYADPVIDWLDAGRGILSRRLFRESCTQLPNGSYTKDLSLIEQDLSRVCLIDNSPISYNVNPANGIPIEGWISDPSDEALLHLLPVLDSLRFATDVRRILGIRLFQPH